MIPKTKRYTTVAVSALTAVMLVLMVAIPSEAQPPDRTWRRTYGLLDHTELGYSATEHPEGGYVVGGHHSYYAPGHRLLLRLHPSGLLLGAAALDGYGRPNSLDVVPGIGVAWTNESNYTSINLTSNDGELLWSHNLYWVPSGADVTVLQDSVIAVGTADADSLGSPAELMLFDVDGILLQSHQFQVPSDSVIAVRETDLSPSGDLFLVATIGLVDATSFVIRTNIEGELLNSSSHDDWIIVSATSDNGFIAAGQEFVRRYDHGHNQIWSSEMVDQLQTLTAVRTTDDGGIAIGGIDTSLSRQGLLLRFDAAGNLLWTYETSGPEGWETGINDVLALDDGYLLVGWTEILTPLDDFPQILVEKLELDVTDYRIVARPRQDPLIVERGAGFRWDGGLKNNLDSEAEVDVWTLALKPDGTLTETIAQWDFTLQPGDTLTASPFQYVPADAPLGDYNYIVRVGEQGAYPQHRFEDVIPLTVVEAGDPRANNAPAAAPLIAGSNSDRPALARNRGLDAGQLAGQSENPHRPAVARNRGLDAGQLAGQSENPHRPAVARNRGLDAGQATAPSDDPRGQARTGGTDLAADDPRGQARTGGHGQWKLTGEWTVTPGELRTPGPPEPAESFTYDPAAPGFGEAGLHPGLRVAPNPFNAAATVRYTLAAPGEVTLAVYDLLGRRVATLADGVRTSGEHTAVFDARELSSGTYMLRLTAGEQTISRKLTVVK